MDSERLMEEALNLRAMANDTGASQLERKKYLKEAAEIYKSVGENELAADCFYDMEDYKTAGDIYNNILSMWEKARDCYHRAKCYQLAAEYHKAGAFIECLSACSDGNLFEFGFELLERWEGFDKEKLFLKKCADYYDLFRHKIRVFLRKRKFFIELRLLEMKWYNDKEAAQAAEDGADHYYLINDFKTMMRCVRSFSSKDMMRRFLCKKRCYDQLILLVEQWGNSKKAENIVDEAAKVLAEAARYYLSVNDFVTMMKYVRLFSSEDEMRGFLKEMGCFDERISLKNDANIVVEAARYYFSANDFIRMMKYVRLFPSECEMWKFLHKRGCNDDDILLEKDENIVAARYCFSVNDFVTMMTCVRSFPSKDKMREFLLERRCFDELISLEKEWGNFKKAAKVARMKPDPMLEAELYHMGGLHIESSLTILWHVFLNSQIFKNKPLKQKDELLRKAASYVKGDPDFHQFVCKEVDILSQGTSKEDFIKKGLEFIYFYKKNDMAVNVECVKTINEIKEIEKDVVDLMCSFLTLKNRLNELRLLKEVCGDFVEALKSTNEDDYSLEATLRRLWYVMFGSLWDHGEKAWPLKDFTQKDELLRDVNSYVNHHPDSQESALMRTEVSILSGVEISLPQMSKCLRETRNKTSVRSHFLISRQLLDSHLLLPNEDWTITHLEAELSKDVVCLEGFSYFWIYWKELIWELIKWKFTWRHYDITWHDYECSMNVYDGFISNYFGVRNYYYRYGNNLVLDAEAQWVKETNPILARDGYFNLIHEREFSSAVSQYWCSELLVVAEKVFEKLESLRVYATENNFPVHLQRKILTSLYQLTKSLQKCKIPYSRKQARSIVNKYIRPCVEQFLTKAFHIDWRISHAKEMIFLRGTETCRDMLKEAVNTDRKYRRGSTRWQIGRIAMIFMGSNLTKLNGNTKNRIIHWYSPNWRDLFMRLTNGDSSTSKNWNIAVSLHSVVKETFSAGFGRANVEMSPACFLYFLERILILSFCFRGYVFTTRLSFVEWIGYENWSMVSGVGCVISKDTRDNIFDSLASIVIDMLKLNFQEVLKEWVTKSEEPESSYPTLVLRLIVLLSLICVNSEEHYNQVLLDILGHGHIVSLLTSSFRETLIRGMQEDRLMDAVADACEEIDNPLVIVNFKEEFGLVVPQNAINLNLQDLNSGKEQLVDLLYNE
ncbi:uncharacterized protein [Rutidosis leptorrhynchoides]|uniref:uncharacterized protein n=1 Tax=Rutidosis leptorrhynchoides TaxID=125765 RepID=UPI003A99DCD3